MTPEIDRWGTFKHNFKWNTAIGRGCRHLVTIIGLLMRQIAQACFRWSLGRCVRCGRDCGLQCSINRNGLTCDYCRQIGLDDELKEQLDLAESLVDEATDKISEALFQIKHVNKELIGLPTWCNGCGNTHHDKCPNHFIKTKP